MKLGRPRLSGERSSREYYHCPVPSCKLTPRAENFRTKSNPKQRINLGQKVIFLYINDTPVQRSTGGVWLSQGRARLQAPIR